MALNKREMTRYIARHTSLTYAQSREALDALLEVWFNTLAAGESIAVDHFLSLHVQRIERNNPGKLLRHGQLVDAGKVQYRLQIRPSEKLQHAMKDR